MLYDAIDRVNVESIGSQLAKPTLIKGTVRILTHQYKLLSDPEYELTREKLYIVQVHKHSVTVPRSQVIESTQILVPRTTIPFALKRQGSTRKKHGFY